MLSGLKDQLYLDSYARSSVLCSALPSRWTLVLFLSCTRIIEFCLNATGQVLNQLNGDDSTGYKIHMKSKCS